MSDRLDRPSDGSEGRPSGRPSDRLRDPFRARRSVHSSLVWSVLREALAERAAETGRPALTVVDVGGGTGGFAVPLAELGHEVTVVDPTPDALAALQRRAGEAGVTDRVRAVQGDVVALRDVVGTGSVDAVLCHSVLEVLDDSRDVDRAVDAIAAVLRPGGLASVVVAGRNAAVLGRVLAGHPAEARHALADPDGRWGSSDPVPRRFGHDEIVGRLGAAGLLVRTVHGVRVFADLLPGGPPEGDATALQALRDLEAAAAQLPAFRDIATQLHVLAARR